MLPKQVKPADVLEALRKLRLAGEDEQVRAEPALVPIGTKVEAEARISAIARDVAEEVLQRNLRAMLDTLREQVRDDVRESFEQAEERIAPVPQTPSRRAGMRLPLLSLSIALFVAAGAWVWGSDGNFGEPAAVESSNAAQVPAVTAAPLTLAAAADEDPSAEQRRHRFLDTLAWALNRHAQYEFGQQPFDDQRLVLLVELLDRLAGVDFGGTVRLRAQSGRFCLAHDEAGELVLAAPDMPVGQCIFPPAPAEQARSTSAGQSVSFANFLWHHHRLRKYPQARSAPSWKPISGSAGNSQPLGSCTSLDVLQPSFGCIAH